MRKRVLIVDNDVDFLDTCSDVLAAEGYETRKAVSREQAVTILDESWVHLVIIDLRLRDDNDDKDVSGLTLAKEENYKAIPKIILTRWPTVSAVREALGPAMEGLPPAVDFLDKGEGMNAMLASVTKAFERHIPVGWELVIESNEQNPLTFLQLANSVLPGADGAHLLQYTEELEDLFRRLFRGKSRIRIERPLWHRKGRAALAVFAFSEADFAEQLIVVCGQKDVITAEALSYEEYAPKAPGLVSTVLSESAGTTHFAANVYALAGFNLDKVLPLAEVYRSAAEGVFHTTLSNLFGQTLAEWHREGRITEESKTLQELYRERLGIASGRATRAAVEERLQSIMRLSPTLGLTVKGDANNLTFSLRGDEFSYPNPLRALDESSNVGQPVVLMIIPGLLTGSNILTDASDRAWLTDFAEAGMAPLLWNYLSLESSIRFDWVEARKFEWIYQMEMNLVGGEFSKLNIGELEQPLRRPARAIRTIRRLASKNIGKDEQPYHLGILYHALARIADYNPTTKLMPHELTRLVHALISSAIIYERFLSHLTSPLPLNSRERGIRIDKINRTVWVNGTRVPLRSRAFSLLLGLYEHANTPCSRRQILEQFLGERYDETDESQISRLNTAIFRLREKIEDDPHNPRYLLTEPSGGYYLVLMQKNHV